ncbi:MAG TPA: sterol desaturase family protein [Chitinophaga sp.]|uniref:sterol desaturase family protein n=1 Tax=Chitinophaga sp. TaxID=1869181 RepID=UPI002DBD3E11|nr:sterol desaturase family protein [Chitinophaga sp.]HEU4552322.1 sterol desaturase family protein [Chitinophaga sp.]
MKKNYVSNSEESVRMFKAGWMEALSKVHFTVPLILYVPVILYCIWHAFAVAGMGILSFIGCFAAGLFLWTITEYIMHRWVFHYIPKSKWGLRLHFIFHGVHHDYPNDRLRLVLPPSVSIPLAVGFYFLFRALMGEAYLYAFYPGFVFGYLCYDISHYAFHHLNFKNKLWMKLKKHHMLHHYSDDTKGYGVSSALWDKIFGSDFIKK